MKLVKKLLRLLPFILIFGSIIFMTFSRYYQSPINFDFNKSDWTYAFSMSDDLFIWAVDGLVSPFTYIVSHILLLTNYSPFNGLWNWFSRQFLYLADDTLVSLIKLSFSLLLYELYMSLLFLMFDVFSFIISVAERFINKGERSND